MKPIYQQPDKTRDAPRKPNHAESLSVSHHPDWRHVRGITLPLLRSCANAAMRQRRAANLDSTTSIKTAWALTTIISNIVGIIDNHHCMARAIFTTHQRSSAAPPLTAKLLQCRVASTTSTTIITKLRVGDNCSCQQRGVHHYQHHRHGLCVEWRSITNQLRSTVPPKHCAC